MQKKCFLLFAYLFTVQYLIGQDIIKGSVKNISDSTALPFVTVTIYNMDSSVLTYSLTRQNGSFAIPYAKDKAAYLLITASGFLPLRKETGHLTNDNESFYLIKSYISLDSLLIVAERPPIIVSNDTIIYSALAIKMLPDALLKDLLKKLPGVQIENGILVVNGKRVNELLIDGKQFFAGNMSLGLNNLPANIVDKVQVYEKDKEYSNSPVQQNMVINIKLKKYIKLGWFGKVYGGTGIENKFEAGALANLFRDTLQISLLGFSNNVNKAGFGIGDIEEIGGFNRNLNLDFEMNGDFYKLNGVSMGGSNKGIQQSNGIGFNLNHTPKKNIDLSLNYFLTNNDLETGLQTISSQQSDTKTFIQGLNTNGDFEKLSHQVGFALKWKPVSNLTINLGSKFNFERNAEIFNNTQQFKNSFSTIVANTSNNLNLYSNNHLQSYNAGLQMISKSKKTRFVINSKIIVAHNLNNGDLIYDFAAAGSVEKYKQHNFRRYNNILSKNTFNISQNLKSKFSIGLIGSVDTYFDSLNFRFDRNMVPITDTVVSPSFVNRKARITTLNPFIRRTYKGIQVSLGIGGAFLNLQNMPAREVYRYFYYPTLSLSKGEFQLSINANLIIPPALNFINYQNLEQPQIFYLRNNSLKETFSHNLDVQWSKFNWQKGSMVLVALNLSSVLNPLVIIRNINEIGKTYIITENGQEQFGVGASIVFSGKIKPMGLKYTLSLNPALNEGYIDFNKTSSTFTNFSWTPFIRFGKNVTKELEATLQLKYYQSTTNFRSSNLNDINFSYYGLNSNINYHQDRYIAEGSIASLILPKNNYASSTNISVVNISVSRLFLKERKLQMKASCYDLFNENTGIIRMNNGNNFITGNELMLRRYGMLSLIYNLRSVKKAGGSRSLIFDRNQ